MATTVIQRRNIVLLGKTGGGKSSVANKIANHYSFEVRSSATSVTSKVSHIEIQLQNHETNTEFNFKIIDTIGVFDTKRKNDDVINDIKKYFQDKVTEGVNLVLFVFRKGRFTAEEREAFDYIIKNFRPLISDISALIITHCELENEQGRQKVIDDFKKAAEDIATFMKKGIYAVGFPDTTRLNPVLKDAYEKLMKKDADNLRDLAMKAGDMRLGKELFTMSFWDKLKQCVLL